MNRLNSPLLLLLVIGVWTRSALADGCNSCPLDSDTSKCEDVYKPPAGTVIEPGMCDKIADIPSEQTKLCKKYDHRSGYYVTCSNQGMSFSCKASCGVKVEDVGKNFTIQDKLKDIMSNDLLKGLNTHSNNHEDLLPGIGFGDDLLGFENKHSPANGTPKTKKGDPKASPSTLGQGDYDVNKPLVIPEQTLPQQNIPKGFDFKSLPQPQQTVVNPVNTAYVPNFPNFHQTAPGAHQPSPTNVLYNQNNPFLPQQTVDGQSGTQVHHEPMKEVMDQMSHFGQSPHMTSHPHQQQGNNVHQNNNHLNPNNPVQQPFAPPGHASPFQQGQVPSLPQQEHPFNSGHQFPSSAQSKNPFGSAQGSLFLPLQQDNLFFPGDKQASPNQGQDFLSHQMKDLNSDSAQSNHPSPVPYGPGSSFLPANFKTGYQTPQVQPQGSPVGATKHINTQKQAPVPYGPGSPFLPTDLKAGYQSPSVEQDNTVSSTKPLSSKNNAYPGTNFLPADANSGQGKVPVSGSGSSGQLPSVPYGPGSPFLPVDLKAGYQPQPSRQTAPVLATNSDLDASAPKAIPLGSSSADFSSTLSKSNPVPHPATKELANSPDLNGVENVGLSRPGGQQNDVVSTDDSFQNQDRVDIQPNVNPSQSSSKGHQVHAPNNFRLDLLRNLHKSKVSPGSFEAGMKNKVTAEKPSDTTHFDHPVFANQKNVHVPMNAGLPHSTNVHIPVDSTFPHSVNTHTAMDSSFPHTAHAPMNTPFHSFPQFPNFAAQKSSAGAQNNGQGLSGAGAHGFSNPSQTSKGFGNSFNSPGFGHATINNGINSNGQTFGHSGLDHLQNALDKQMKNLHKTSNTGKTSSGTSTSSSSGKTTSNSNFNSASTSGANSGSTSGSTSGVSSGTSGLSNKNAGQKTATQSQKLNPYGSVDHFLNDFHSNPLSHQMFDKLSNHQGYFQGFQPLHTFGASSGAGPKTNAGKGQAFNSDHLFDFMGRR